MGSCTLYSVFYFFLLLLQGFGRAFRLEVAVVVAGEAAAEEPAGDEDEDDADAAAGAVPSGLGSSSARLFTGLFEGQSSFVEYTPDPQIAQYILSSRKWHSEAAPEQSLPRKQHSVHHRPSTSNVLVALNHAFLGCFLVLYILIPYLDSLCLFFNRWTLCYC